MKYRLLLIALATTFAGCDSQNKAAQETERRQLEERVAAAEKDQARLVAERQAETTKRVEAERKAAVADRNVALAESARLESERQRLQHDLEKLQTESAELATRRAKMKGAELAAGEAMEKRLEAQRAEVEAARARAEEERRKLDIARARADAERMAAEKATAEAVAREAAAKRAQELARTQTIAVFFPALESAGEWFESDRYGFVWRPYASVKNPSWRPYADGRWLYTDFGWTWLSNEPFGWAVYHYGRWMRVHGTGWVWVPGSEWAPAWVAWRWHRPREYIGWAPLPPEAQDPKGFDVKVDSKYDIGPGSYAFLPIADFDAPTYLGKFAAPERSKEILPLTTNITYMAPKAGGGMVCGGPDVGLINSEIRRLRNDLELKAVGRVSIQLLNSPAPSAAPDVLNAGAVMYFAPQLKASPAVGKPDRLKGRIEMKAADRGWNPANPWESDEWRGRLKADAAAADAADYAASHRPPPAPRATPAPAPAATPAPQPVAPRPRPGPGGLQGSQLQPSSPLFPRKP